MQTETKNLGRKVLSIPQVQELLRAAVGPESTATLPLIQKAQIIHQKIRPTFASRIGTLAKCPFVLADVISPMNTRKWRVQEEFNEFQSFKKECAKKCQEWSQELLDILKDFPNGGPFNTESEDYNGSRPQVIASEGVFQVPIRMFLKFYDIKGERFSLSDSANNKADHFVLRDTLSNLDKSLDQKTAALLLCDWLLRGNSLELFFQVYQQPFMQKTWTLAPDQTILIRWRGYTTGKNWELPFHVVRRGGDFARK